MEPRTFEALQELAIRDPVAAYGIALGIPQIPWSASMSGVFPTLAVGSVATPTYGPATGQLPVGATFPPNTVFQRTWVDNINYSLQCPDVFPNQIFKPQFDAFLKQNTGIIVKLEILGGPKYLVSPQYTPLENLVNMVRADRWPAGWPLFKMQTLEGLFQLVQSPGSVPVSYINGDVLVSNGSYYFTLTFNGWQFQDCTIDNMDPKEAREKLRAAGILVTKPLLCP